MDQITLKSVFWLKLYQFASCHFRPIHFHLVELSTNHSTDLQRSDFLAKD